LLIYGNSFMREVGISILCENAGSFTKVYDRADRNRSVSGLETFMALPVKSRKEFGGLGTFVFGSSSVSFLTNAERYQAAPAGAIERHDAWYLISTRQIRLI